MKANFFKITIQILSLALLVSCQNNSNDSSTPSDLNPLKAEILISDVSSDKCLNLEKLTMRLNNPRFSFPAAIMTTNYKPVSEISSAKSDFFSFSTFYYKQTKANELALFSEVKQTDCTSLQILSASREVLTYKIVENSDLYIKFQLADSFRETMSTVQKQASFDRIQPYEYTVIFASKNNLKVIEKYKSVDPLCESKKTLKMEITKNIAWAQTEAELPSRYEMNAGYFGKVKSAVQVDPTVALPELDTAGTVAVTDIKTIMNLPIRNELKYCN